MNGASTALFQMALRTLLEGRPPSPLAPVPAPIPAGGFTPPGGFGMPTLNAEPPSVAPIAPLPARDESLIEQLTGPRPVAPVEQPVSLLQKIALALQGFGAGVQGQGPQFLAGLQEQRERPQREFQAATEQFEDRRRRATVFAEEKQQREQGEIQRRADIQSGRDFQLYEGELRDRRQEARDLRQQAAALEREQVKADAEKREQERKQAEENKKRVDNIAKELFDDLKISRQQARAFAEFEVNGTPLSQADAKIYNRLEKYRRPVGGTGAAASPGPVMAQLENDVIVPASLVNREKGIVILDGAPMRVVRYIGGHIPAQQPQAAPPPIQYSEFGLPLAPQQTQQAQPGKTVTMAEVKRHAAKTKTSVKEAEQQFKDAGYSIQP